MKPTPAVSAAVPDQPVLCAPTNRTQSWMRARPTCQTHVHVLHRLGTAPTMSTHRNRIVPRLRMPVPTPVAATAQECTPSLLGQLCVALEWIYKRARAFGKATYFVVCIGFPAGAAYCAYKVGGAAAHASSQQVTQSHIGVLTNWTTTARLHR